MLKRANDLKTISNWLVLLSSCFRNLKPFRVNKNRSWAPQTHTRDPDPRFPPSIYRPRASRLGHKSRRKNSVRNLRYGPRTRLVRGMYYKAVCDILITDKVNKNLYYIQFEITGYPYNVIGSQRCDLFPNRTIFCSKSHLFSRPMRMAQKNKTTNHISRLFLT